MANNKYTPAPRKYYKTNFVDLIELITPDVYQNEDLSLSGVELNPISQVINTHLLAANNISNVLSISGVANTQTSSLGNISGISQYFVKQNELTKISAQTLESKILLPLGTTFANYDSSSDFNTYLSGTLLPMIVPATGSEYGGPVHSNTTLSALTGNSDPSSIHNYLVDALGWFYFLNTSADGGLDYSPSSYVLSSFNTLYTGNTLQTVDGIKGFTEYIWKNYATCSLFSNLGLIPGPYVSGTADGITDVSAGNLPTYTSGTQRLENLQTLIDVIYSPLFIDQQDYTVKTAFQDYIDANTVLEDQVSKGPYRKFNNLVGFNFADISNQIDNIGLIYDIENAKDEHLQYIADLIGWKLRGIDPSKWRHQLRTAVDLYKKSGTMEAIQTALNTLVVDSVLDVSGNASELWESYLPFLIWYSLGTESPLFKDLSTWTAGLAQQSQVGSYSPSSLEENLKIVTDSILLEAYKAFPKIFKFHGEDFPVPRLFEINERGELGDLYTLVGDPLMRPFHAHIIDGPGYEYSKREAYKAGHAVAWDAAISNGPLGSGVYMAGLEHPNYFLEEVPQFLSATGDMEFVFNYRNRINYPMPPFEEIKYYKDSTLTPEFLEFIAEKLRCFQVKPSFVTNFQNYVLSAAITTDTSLGSLNEFLMFFSSVQVPPNFDDVMLKVSDHEKNILDLWNGKSSHLFIDFNTDDFDFAKDTLEGDGKYALYEASRIAKEFTPAHSITRVNLNAPAMDDYHDPSSTEFTYLGIDRDGNRASYTSASILGNFSYSGVLMGKVYGEEDGRGGLGVFKRNDVDRITDTLLSSTTGNAGNGNNQLFYTKNPGDDPGIVFNSDLAGNYWERQGAGLATFSAVISTNPDNGASSLLLSGTKSTTNKATGLFQTNHLGSSLDVTKSTILSVYVKQPETNAASSFMITQKNQTANEHCRQSFDFVDGVPVPKNSSSEGTRQYSIIDAGGGWYRIVLRRDGDGGWASTASNGQEIRPYIYISDWGADDGVNLSEKILYWYGAQFETVPLNTEASATAYFPGPPVTTQISNIGRRALRRRNFRYLLPKEGYYDRTGFNGPVNYNLQPQNVNFLPYTEDLGGSPGLDMGVAPTNGSSIDIEGTYWRGNKSKLGTFSSTLETNPFGGASSTDMSATQYTTGGQAAIYGANIPAKPKWKEKYYTIQSWYVKKPGTNPSPEFKINNYDQTAPVNSNSVTFEWDGNEAVVKTLHDTGTTAHVESVGNDWYRCSITSEGLGGGGDTVEGDNLIPYFYLIHDASDPVHLYISSPQLEQKLIANGDTLPSTYQAVAGEHPANQDRGELTLGYVPSAGQFYPIVDPINPSGVWHECETLESQKTFSGIATSATFPYRGVLPLGSNYFTDASTPAYVDRGQVPLIYNTMHELYEKKALDYANEQIKLDPSAFQAEMYWKNQLQSFANSAIASGLVLNSYDDYINFSFGTGLQKTYADYVKYFSNPLGLTEIDKTGGNIFAQVFGKGLYNCDFDIAGSAVSNLISPQTTNASSINTTSIWNTTADGTYIAQGSGRGVVPLSGTFIEGNPNNAEYRNPDILSGIEFTDISGAPDSNQFTIFKLDSSVATKGMENALVGNTVIKAKSLGGLPRLRFDLSSYGERPNKFIKDHYFKLKVKSLVAEENSPLLGGGQLGVWIHTQPNPRPNPNLLSMTENEILATIPDIWNKGSDIGTVSSVELTNPFGGASSLIMSGAPGAGNYAGVKALSSMPRMPKWDAQKTVAASFFVKKPASNAASGFMIDIVNADTTDPAYDDHTIQFNWDGTEPVCIAKSPSVMTSSIEDYGDGWYRVSTTVEGLVNTTEQQTGDAMHCHFFLGDTQYATDTIEFKTIHLWGFQLEQYYTDGNFDGPSPYEAVTGLLPDPLITNDYMWCWTPKNKWEFIKQEDISISKVLTSLTHRYDFDTYMGGQSSNEPTCLGNVLSQGDSVTNDNTLLNIQDSYFQTAEIDFNTRNYTEENNSEYLQVIPIPEDLYKINNQVHTDDTNYVVEIFFIPNNNPNKYLLIDSIELYDVTQADNAALPTGHGIETSGIPLKKFVKEDKLYLNKNQLRDVLRFYNGLIGQGTGVYATDLASRDATITSGIMEVSGGSRLNYRLSPTWGATNAGNTVANFNNINEVELDN